MSLIHDVISERGWSHKRVLDLAFAFLSRRGLLVEFESYLVRASKNERDEAASLKEDS